MRLPGEDEWAFAARGGLAVSAAGFAAPLYPLPEGLARGLVAKREGGTGAAPIGGPRANPLGLHDMLGNLEEVMLDLYRVDGAPGEIGGYVVRGGSFYTNAFGLYDTTGNVWEWVQDCSHGSYQGAPSNGTAWTIPCPPARVLRGGSWATDAWLMRVSERNRGAPFNRTDFLGLRLAQDP